MPSENELLEQFLTSENKNIHEPIKITPEDQERLRVYADNKPDLDALRAEIEGKFKPIRGFVIEEEFQAYCKRCRLDLDTCSPVQAIEMRRVFYGAVGQLLVYLRDDLAAESQDDGVTELERIWQQVKMFWDRQGKGVQI
jgi:hypothetical protein